MNSVRERLLRILVDRLLAALAPAAVLRQPATPLPREASPALLVFVEGDALTAHANRLVERALTVRLVALAAAFVAQRRRVRPLPESEIDPRRLRWRRTSAEPRTGWRNRLSHRARELLLP